MLLVGLGLTHKSTSELMGLERIGISLQAVRLETC